MMEGESMKRCHRPEWSHELSDYCECDFVSNIDPDELPEIICTDCRWFFDIDDAMEATAYDR